LCETKKILTYHEWLNKNWEPAIKDCNHFSNLLAAIHFYSQYYEKETKKECRLIPKRKAHDKKWITK
jgi:hypothetical protein